MKLNQQSTNNNTTSSLSRMGQILKLKRKDTKQTFQNVQSGNGMVVTSECQVAGNRNSNSKKDIHLKRDVRSSPNNLQSANKNQDNDAAISIIRRILSLLHMFAWTQFGTCASFCKYHLFLSALNDRIISMCIYAITLQ